jgi:uncharacterized membrane protein
MPTIERSIDIDRPAGDVWAVLEDVRRLPDFSPSTVEVTAPPRLDHVGQTFRQVVVLAGRRFESEWKVAGLVPGRCLAIEGSLVPGTHYRINEQLHPLADDRCRFTLRMQYKLPFGPLGRLAGKLGVESKAADEAAGLLEGLKRVVERREAAAAPG